MANEWYCFTQPTTAAVQLTLDTGQVIAGVKGTFKGRDDGNLLQIPLSVTATLGSELRITQADGRITFQNRGLLIPSATGEAIFALDDVRYVETPGPKPPDPPIPPPSNDPLGIITAVYATGLYNLATKEGCGLFTEACCTELHERNNQLWGHFKKNPGQNQFNEHAVDAVQCLGGPYTGGWDIIHDSVSAHATPSFNLAGPPAPEIWYYPAAPIPPTVMTASVLGALDGITRLLQRLTTR